MSSLPEYDALVAKIDAFLQKVERGQGQGLSCRKGCDACCCADRTAFAVEVAAIREWLQAHPDVLQAVRDRAPKPSRCLFIDAEGACSIYPVRPLICRTHGPAVQSSEGLVWCSRCFAGLSEAEVKAQVPPESVMNLDLVNQLLVLVNLRYLQTHSEPERADLAQALQVES